MDSHHPVRFYQRLLSWLVSAMLATQPLLPAVAATLTPTGAGTQIDKAGNGVPVVNIATPNGAGISHNQFKDYNVGKEGIILNNATGQLNQTQLGGLIQNNPNLKAGQEARGIINEVTGGNRSQLQGYTEVAGKAANVVVANPYGITCNGCGFINTPNATLTTGKPVFDTAGNLQSFDVTKGSITVEGKGLDASQTDALSIIARATEVNAQIHTKDLKIIAGANRVDASGNATAITGEGAAPVVAVDTGALGGMYANRIHLISSEKGVGVNLGDLNARQGDITLDASGKLTVKNSLTSGSLVAKGESVALNGENKASGAFTVNAQTDVTVDNAQLASDGDMTLSGKGKLTLNNATLTAGKDLSLTARDLTQGKNSRADTANNITVSVAGTTDNQGQFVAGKNISINSNALTNNGKLSAKGTAQITANTLANSGGVQSLGDQWLTANTLNNSGQWQSGGDINLTTQSMTLGGLFSSAHTLNLNVADMLNIDTGGQLLSDGYLSVSADILQLSGVLNGHDGITLHSEQLTSSNSSLLTSNGAVNIDTGSAQLGGKLFAQQDATLTSRGQFNTLAGSQLQSQQNLALNAQQAKLAGTQAAKNILQINSTGALTHSGQGTGQTINVQSGALTTTGLLQATGNLNLNSGAIDQSGNLIAGQNLRIDGLSLNNRGTLQATDAVVALKGAFDNQASGKLLAQRGLTLSTASAKNAGQLVADSALTLSTPQMSNSGLLQGQDLTVRGDSLDNRGQLLARDIILDQQNRLVNQAGGKILAQDALSLSAPVLTNSGTLAASDLQLTTTSTTNGGTLQGDSRLALNADVLSNQAGAQILSGSGLTLSLPQLVNLGLIKAALDMTLSGTSLDNAGEINARSLTLSQRGALTNRQGGKLLAQEALVLKGNHVSNSGVAAGDTLQVDATTVSNSGRLQGSRALTLTATDLTSQGELLTDGALTAALIRLTNAGLMQGGSLTVRGDSLDNRGQLLARDITLAQQNQIVNQAGGRILAREALSLSAPVLTNSGTLAASELALTTTSTTNGGTLQGDSRLALTADTLTNQAGGQILSGSGLTLSLPQLVNLGLIKAALDMTLSGNSLDNAGEINARSLTLSQLGALTNRQGGKLLAQDALVLKGNNISNSGVAAGDTLVLDATTVSNSGRLQGSRALTLTATDLTSQGELLTDGALTAALIRLTNAGLMQGGSLTLRGDSLDNRGQLLARDITLAQQNRIVNQADGRLLAQDVLSLSAPALTNSGTLAASDLELTTTTTTNSGTLQGDKRLALNADVLSNQAGGQILSGSGLTLSLPQLVNLGLIKAALDMTLSGTSLDNAGEINARSLTLNQRGALTNRQGGKLLAQEALTLKGSSVSNSGVAAGDTLLVDAGTVSNSGRLQGSRALILTAADLTSEGELLTDGALTAALIRLTNGGLMQAASLTVRGDSLDNRGQLLARNITLEQQNQIVNQTGSEILARDTLDLTSPWLINDGVLAADRFTLTGNTFTNRGLLQGTRQLDLTTSVLDNQAAGQIFSDGSLTLDAKNLTNSGLLQGDTLTVHAGQWRNEGNALAENGVIATVDGDMIATGRLLSQQGLQLSAKNLTHSGMMAADSVTLNTDRLLNSGLIQGNRGLTVTKGDITNAPAGQLLSGQALNLTGGLLDNQGLLQGDSLTVRAGEWSNSGKALGSHGVTGTVSGVLTSSGVLLSQNDMQLQAKTLDNSGTMAANNLTVGADSLSNGGLLQGNTQLMLNAPQLSNLASGQLISGGALALTLKKLINAGALQVSKLFTLNATSLDNSGSLQAQNINLTLSGALTNQAKGNILAQQDLTAQTGTISNNGVMAGDLLNLTGNGITSSGLLQGNSSLMLGGSALSNLAGGQILTDGALNLSLGQLDNAGLLQGKSVTLTSNRWSNSGRTLAAQDLNATVNGAFDSTGLLLSQGNLQLSAQSVDNSGQLAAETISLSGGSLDNRGTLQGNNGFTLTTSSMNNRAGGQLISNSDMRLDAAEQSNSGLIIALALLTLNAESLDNDGTFQADNLQLKVNQKLISQRDGRFLAKQALNLNGGELVNDGQMAGDRLTLNVANTTNQGLLQGVYLLALTGTGLNNLTGGRLLTNGALELTTTNLTNGGILQGQKITVNSGTWNNVGSALGTDALDVTVTGDLTNSGQLLSHGTTQVNSARLTNVGALLSEGNVTLTGNQLINHGSVQGGNLSVGNGLVDNSGTLIGMQSLTLQAAQNLQTRLLMAQPLQVLTNNKGGSLLTQGTLKINGGDITNSGSWQGQQILLTATKVQNNGAIQSADGMNLTVSGDLLSAANSKITANGSAALQALNLTNNGQWIAKNLTLRGTTFNNNGETSGVSGLTLSLNGVFTQQQDKTLLTGGTLALNAASVNNLGRIQGGDTQITSGRLDNQGRIQGDNGLRLTLTGNLTNSAAGSILSQKALTITTPNLINYGILQGGASSRIDAVSTARNDGKLLFGSDLTLNTAGLNNNNWLQATTLVLNAANASNNGTLLAGNQATLTGNDLTNTGTIQAANLTSNYQSLTNSGTLLGNTQLTITASQVNHQATGKLFSGGNLLLNSAGFDQLGQVVALGDLAVGVTNAFTTRNVMAAGNQLTLTGNGDITNQSVMQGQGLTILAGGALTNNGQLTAGSAASNLSGSRIAMNAAGSLQSGGDVTLTSRGDIAFNGFTGTRGSLTASAAGSLLNTALLYAGNNMSLLANSIHNQKGDILAGNNLWMQRDTAGNANTEVVNTSGTIETQRGDISIKTGHLLNERDGLTVSVTENDLSDIISGTYEILARDMDREKLAVSEEEYCAGKNDHCHTTRSIVMKGDDEKQVLIREKSVTATAQGAAARIAAGRNMDATAGSLENKASYLLASGNMMLSGASLNNSSVETGRTSVYGVYKYICADNSSCRPSGTNNSADKLDSLLDRLGGKNKFIYVLQPGLIEVSDSDSSLYRSVIQAGGNVVANFTNNISNTNTTANTGGVSNIISAPSLNTLSNQNISGGVQKQNLANADKVAVGSPQWQDQLQNALQQINGGGSLASLNAAQGNTISLNGGQVGLNHYGTSGGTVDINGNAVGMNDYSTQGGNGVSLNGQGSSLNKYTGTGGNTTSLSGNAASLNNYTGTGGNTTALSGNAASLNGYKASAGMAETVNTRAVDLSAYPLPTSNSGYFVAVSDPKSPYLIATNPKLDGLGQLDPSLFGDLYNMTGNKPGEAPRETNSTFTDQNKFLGSSYFLDRLNLKPEYDYRFLGDAAFDTRYVANAMLNQTGNRYLNGVGSDLEQMQSLMDNAARAQQSLGLNFGIALTADQIASLDHSILWWEATTINGETVMVPKLYLSPKDVTVNNGSVIAGNNVTLNGGSITNSGSTMTAGNNLSLNSQNSISNLNAGLMNAGGGLQLSALGDINNIGSAISGKTVALESINGSINNITLVDNWSLASSGKSDQLVSLSTAQVGNTASITSLDSLSLSAGQDINITGANVSAGGNLLMDAWGDIAVSANQVTSGYSQSGFRGKDATSKESVTQSGSTITAGGNLGMQAGNDLTLAASAVNAGGNATLMAGNDLNLNAAQTGESASKGKSESHSTDIARTTVSSGGDLQLAAGRDINSQAAGLAAENDVAMQAGRDVNLLAQETTEGSSYKSSKKKEITESVRQQGTEILSGGDTTIIAGRDVTAEASEVVAGGDIGLNAGRDVTLTTATESHYHYKEEKKKSGGFLSKKTTHTISENSNTSEKGTLLSGNSVTVNAGNNLLVQGSDVVADRDVALVAGNDVSVIAATDTDTSWRFKETKKSGLMGTGGIGITVGTSKSTHDRREAGTTQSQSASTVGSTAGSVSITAGNQARISGSDVVASRDISITGDSVLIDPGHDKRSVKEKFEQKSTGVTLALSGAVGEAINSAVSSAQEAKENSDSRLGALKGTQAILSGVQAGANYGLQQQSADPNNGIGVSISLNHQQSKSETKYQHDMASGSGISAGNNVSITATGKNKGQNNSGDILIAGSQVKAGNDLTLDAQNDVLLSAAASTQQTTGKNSSKGGGAGVSFGGGSNGGGLSIFASVNGAKGSEKGNGTTWTETTLDAGRNVAITSGRDTTLNGAQVNGEKVTADVGNNLTLSSLQDSDRFESKQSSVAAGGSFTFGGGGGSAYVSASQDKIRSNYDSVQEQSGIYAGKGGFDVTVGNHTRLDGAVIASTATADKNRLDTGTLSWTDIHNEAGYKTSHTGISISGASGMSAGQMVAGNAMANAANALTGMSGSKGHAEGTTSSAISGGSIVIRDKDKQKQDVADLSRDVENANGSIAPIFDKEKEQQRLQAAQVLSQISGQMSNIVMTLGETAGMKTAREKHPGLSDAELRNTPEYKDTVKGYGTGSTPQMVVQAITGVLGGLSADNFGQALAGGLSPAMAQAIRHATGDNQEANLMAHAVWGALAAQLGGNSAAAGAAGAFSGEAAAQYIINNYYGGKTDNLSEQERRQISTLATIAAGIAGGLSGNSTEAAGAGAQAGKNAVENNSLSGDKARETIKQAAESLKDQVRDKLGEGATSSIANAIINGLADTGDAALGGADYAADAAMALASCAVGDSYCSKAISDLSGKNQAVADNVKALMSSDTWSAVKDIVVQASEGNQAALEATGGMLAAIILPGKKLPNVVKAVDPTIKIATGQSVGVFEKSLANLPPGERVAIIKQTAPKVAAENGMVKDNQLTKKNGGRDVYRGQDGNLYALDTQHGRFEVVSPKGKHLGEVDFSMQVRKPADPSGGHNLKVK